MKVVYILAKRAFVPTKLPGADYVVNQYIGCQHACRYCYAKVMRRFYPYGEWGTWVIAKKNLPELVKTEKVRGKIYMSSVSDPYQPIEKELQLTRRILQNMDKELGLSILTKSDLILRDVDLFKEFKEIELGFTLNGLGKEFEPRAPPHKKRVEALKVLKEEGLKTFVFISPIIPGLVDWKEIIKETKSFTDFYWLEFLNLKGAGKEFLDWFREKYEEFFNIYSSRDKVNKLFLRTIKEVKKLNIEVKGVCFHPKTCHFFSSDLK